MMIASAIRFENAIPASVSKRIRRNWPLRPLRSLPQRLGAGVGQFLGLLRACQKNRYGLIVVPSKATMVTTASRPSRRGQTMPSPADRQSTRTTRSTPTYANRLSVSHFSTRV